MSEKKPMTKPQIRRYCDLVFQYREKTGTNPDVAAIDKIAKKARQPVKQKQKPRTPKKEA